MIGFRTATAADLPAIVRLLADDPLGATRERDEEPLPQAYRDAFEAIRAQNGNEIIVAVDGADVIGCLQFTVVPGLSRLGARRGQIEGVRVDKRYRGRRVGEILFRRAIERARETGCSLLQLTTDKARPEARRFYERLGFVASHDGMKLAL
jgi:ribosomal protein S18 acetylase RimI-like enzyme